MNKNVLWLTINPENRINMKRIIIKNASLTFVLVILAGCMAGPKFSRPATHLPDFYRYDTTPDTIYNLAWWEIFRDPQLEAMIDTALKNNLEIAMAARRIEQAAYAVGYNRADLFPALGYDGGVNYGNMGQGGLPLGEESTLFSGMGNVYWEIDFWGKYRRATEAARAELLASELGMQTVQLSVISSVARLYFQLQDFNGRLQVSRSTLITRQQARWIIEERFEKGIVPELDLNQAIIQEAIAEASVPFYESQVAQTEHALSILLGEYPGKIQVGALDSSQLPDSIPAGLPSYLLERRPDIAALEQQVKAQNSRIGIAQAMRFPSFSLTGALGTASTDLSNMLTGDAVVWSVAGNITGPIFNFGKNKRRVEIERARTEEMMLSYQNAVLMAFGEVENALVGVDATRRELAAYERQLTAADKAAKLSWARYDGGVTSYLEVLESERQLFDSELRTLNARFQLMNAYVILYKALGGGWMSPEQIEEDPETEQ